MTNLSYSPPSFDLRYTAPASPDLGQQCLTVQVADVPVVLLAVCGTEIVITRPPGQNITLLPTTLRFTESPEAFVVLLPEDEVEFALAVVVEASAAKAEIMVKTKKERSKPERPLRAAFE